MLKRSRAVQAVLWCILALAGCGGGGGGGGGSTASNETAPELSGTYVLTALSEVLTLASIRAELPPGTPGTPGTPTCRLLSGETPPGMSFAADCSLTGKPTAVGLYRFSLSLSVSGYRGSATVNADYTVGGPAVLRGAWVTEGTPMPLNAAITPATAAKLGAQSVYTVQPGDVVTFQVAEGMLPAGLTLDATTGIVSGTPTVLGDFTVAIGAVLARAGGSYTMAPVRIVGNVRAPFAGLRYETGASLTLTMPVALARSSAPEINPPQPSVASVSYSLTSTLPTGLGLDPFTGVISGTPTQAGSSTFSVRASVTTTSGSRYDLDTGPLTLVLTGMLPEYPIANNGNRKIGSQPGEYPSFIWHTAARNNAVSYAIGSIYGGQGGDVYSYELMATTQPLPSWLSIDASTGTVVAAVPADLPGLLPISYQFEVRVTTQRSGISYLTRQQWRIDVNS